MKDKYVDKRGLCVPVFSQAFYLVHICQGQCIFRQYILHSPIWLDDHHGQDVEKSSFFLQARLTVLSYRRNVFNLITVFGSLFYPLDWLHPQARLGTRAGTGVTCIQKKKNDVKGLWRKAFSLWFIRICHPMFILVGGRNVLSVSVGNNGREINYTYTVCTIIALTISISIFIYD